MSTQQNWFTEMDDYSDEDSKPLQDLRGLVGGRCYDCQNPYSAREAVWSLALGFKNAPRCLACVCKRLGRDESDLRTELIAYVHRRECFLKAWREAEQLDGIKKEIALAVSPPDLISKGEVSADDQWDAGDMGCGELLMSLRIRLNAMEPGRVLLVTATDPSGPEDLPAWCRLCGHTLLAMVPPQYFIRRKE